MQGPPNDPNQTCHSSSFSQFLALFILSKNSYHALGWFLKNLLLIIVLVLLAFVPYLTFLAYFRDICSISLFSVSSHRCGH